MFEQYYTVYFKSRGVTCLIKDYNSETDLYTVTWYEYDSEYGYVECADVVKDSEITKLN